MDLLEGVVRNYDWGSPTAIPDLLRRPATGEPWAELWFGAHPSAPSLVGPSKRPLDELIAADAPTALGAEVARRFDSLPFLLKVLAADSPLSLQAHPSVSQAESGFLREEATGLPADAPDRSFRDCRHKPELICALTEFEALCGFRSPAASVDILATIDTEALDPIRHRLSGEPGAEDLKALLEHLLRLDTTAAASMTESVVAACAADGPDLGRSERAMAAKVGRLYPGDAGVVVALLLNLVTLQPGEALFLDAGNLHAYLGGMGVEIMANSDNVVRGGLTSKRVDVSSLLDVVDAAPLAPRIQRPRVVDGTARYEAPVAEFDLSRIEVEGSFHALFGAAILLCTSGEANIGGLTLRRGSAVWMAADDEAVELLGKATIFCASAGVGRETVSWQREHIH